eukprot:408836_1
MYFLFTLLVSFTAKAQRDCLAYNQIKMEYTITDLGEGTTSTGFWEFYKGNITNGVESGVVEWWSYAGTKTINGTYKMKEAQDNTECYVEMEFDQSKQNPLECMTFSPTIDHLGFVGCYVNTTQCVPVCNTMPNKKWIAAVEFRKQYGDHVPKYAIKPPY